MEAADLPDLLRKSRVTYSVIAEGTGYSVDQIKHVAAPGRPRPISPEFREKVLAFLELRGAEIADAARRLRTHGSSAPIDPAP